MINYKIALQNSNNKINRNHSNTIKFPIINQNKNVMRNKLVLENFSNK